MTQVVTTNGNYTVGALGTATTLPSANGIIYLDSAEVVISGTLVVNGTIINPGQNNNPIFQSNLLTLDAITTPTSLTANDGGLLLLDGSNNLSWTWQNTTNAWTSNVNLDLSSTGSAYYINGTMVLDATSLGSGIIIDGGVF